MVVETEAPPPGPLRLAPAGRLPPTAETWSNPLPPLLAARVEQKKLRHHETMLKRYGAAEAKVAELTERLERERKADEQARRAAIEKGRKVPAAKSPATERELEQARLTLETAGELVAESGRGLVADLTDADLDAAMKKADEKERQIVAGIPDRAAALVAELHRAGELGHEGIWISGFRERRRQAPYRAGRMPTSRQLQQALQALLMADEMIRAHFTEQEWRDAGPPKHNPPSRGWAPPAGHPITSSAITSSELPKVVPAATVQARSPEGDERPRDRD